MGGHQNESHTVVRFRRALDTCDSTHDYVLGVSPVKLLYPLTFGATAKKTLQRYDDKLFNTVEENYRCLQRKVNEPINT